MKKVLIVDDRKINREVLRRSFIFFDKKTEIDIREVGSSTEAIELALSFKPDLILMDLDMETSYAGLDATREIRNKSKDSKMQIWAITSHAVINNGVNVDREKCISAGCNDYFSKPYEQKEIILKISKTLDLPLPDKIRKKLLED